MANQVPGTAYDLSLFETKKVQLVALKPNKKEEKSQSRHARVQSVLNVSAYIAIAAVVLFIIGFLITSNVQLTEMNSRIAASKTQLAELQSEQVRLQSELASKTSIANVNQFAQEHGMTVADSNQICYITVSGEDAVTVAAENTNWLTQAYHAILGIFS